MSATMQDVVRFLSPDEADLHQAAAALDPGAIPHLEALVRGPDPMLAAKAAYVAGLMEESGGIEVLRVAASSPEKMVRVAAGTVVGRLAPDRAAPILTILLTDSDPECRQLAIEAVPDEATNEVSKALELLSLTDPYPLLRESARKILVQSSGSARQPEDPA